MTAWKNLQRSKFHAGVWHTTESEAEINLQWVGEAAVELDIMNGGQMFVKEDLTEFIDFLKELRDSLG